MNVIQILYTEIKEAYLWFLTYFYYRRCGWKMSLAIRLADMKQRAFNRQYHVMLMELPRGDKLVSVSRQDIVKMKSKGWIDRKIRTIDLRDSIFYSTALCRNNKSSYADRENARRKYWKYARREIKGKD